MIKRTCVSGRRLVQLSGKFEKSKDYDGRHFSLDSYKTDAARLRQERYVENAYRFLLSQGLGEECEDKYILGGAIETSFSRKLFENKTRRKLSPEFVNCYVIRNEPPHKTEQWLVSGSQMKMIKVCDDCNKVIASRSY